MRSWLAKGSLDGIQLGAIPMTINWLMTIVDSNCHARIKYSECCGMRTKISLPIIRSHWLLGDYLAFILQIIASCAVGDSGNAARNAAEKATQWVARPLFGGPCVKVRFILVSTDAVPAGLVKA